MRKIDKPKAKPPARKTVAKRKPKRTSQKAQASAKPLKRKVPAKKPATAKPQEPTAKTDAPAPEEKEARGRGRPTKYDPAMCDLVLACGMDGMCKYETAYEIGVCVNTMDNYAQQYPEFLSAITRARELAAGWWARQGRQGINNKGFNANAYALQVRNRFPDIWDPEVGDGNVTVYVQQFKPEDHANAGRRQRDGKRS